MTDVELIDRLRSALRKAITQRRRTSRTIVDLDLAAGSTYEVDWLPEVKAWAELCGLDLSRIDPCPYENW